MNGKMIVVDGIEGGGKSSCIRLIKLILEDYGINVETVREPGGTPMGEEIRSVLLANRGDEEVHENTELMLMFSCRSQLFEGRIKPSLKKGDWVLSDRFSSATRAYQGAGRGIDMNKVEMLENLVLGSFRPQLTFILDLPPEIGMERARGRGELDRIELEEMGFFHRVRKGYLDQATESPERFRVIDASLPQDQVFKQIKEQMSSFLKGLGMEPVRARRGDYEPSI